MTTDQRGAIFFDPSTGDMSALEKIPGCRVLDLRYCAVGYGKSPKMLELVVTRLHPTLSARDRRQLARICSRVARECRNCEVRPLTPVAVKKVRR